VAEGEPRLRAQCHCRERQYISGGAPNLFMLMPLKGFRYVRGAPKTFTRSDLDQPVTREFCANCGAHLTTRRTDMPLVILKVGTLDNPSLYGAPQMAIYTCDKRSPRARRPSNGCRRTDKNGEPFWPPRHNEARDYAHLRQTRGEAP
jgi:hypothetical protein